MAASSSTATARGARWLDAPVARTRAAAEVAPAGVQFELWEGIGELPIYDQELEEGDAPAAVRRLREAWGSADAILFSTPEYNGSVPGGLKNAIDWASRPKPEAVLANRTVAVVGAGSAALIAAPGRRRWR